MQSPKDGNFRAVREWAQQFYKPLAETAAIQEKFNGVLPVKDFPQPTMEQREAGFEDDCFIPVPEETQTESAA